MPVIADPYAARAYGALSDADNRLHRVRSRVRAAVHRGELTRRLAEGADPGASDELAVRAAQLTSNRTRRSLARAMRRTIAEAHRPAMTRARVVIIRRAA